MLRPGLPVRISAGQVRWNTVSTDGGTVWDFEYK